MSPKLTIQEFVDTIIDTQPQPQPMPKLFKELRNNGFYKFNEIHRILSVVARDKSLNINNINNVKFLSYFENKTSKQVSKYLTLLPLDYCSIIAQYINMYNDLYSEYINYKNKKYLLPLPLRKYRNYNYPLIRNTLLNNPEIQNINNYRDDLLGGPTDAYDINDFIFDNIYHKTIKECINIRSKLTKEHKYNKKAIIRVKKELEENELNYDEPDRAYILDELETSINEYQHNIDNYDIKIFLINKYIECLKTLE